jgi:Antidote-toxin recognition MazE, bacterial antitoxin
MRYDGVVFSNFPPMSHQGVLTLPLVKVKEKFQITLPAELREALHLAVGDLLLKRCSNEAVEPL